jgi:hypothetical protein
VLGGPESGHVSTNLVAILGVRAPMPVSGPREERILAIAGRQRARINRLQLRAAGISDSAIGRMVDRGFLRREHRAVYALGPDIAVPWARETAALLACAEGCLLSHHTAGVAWGLLPEYDGDVEVIVPGRQTGSPRGVTVHRTSTLLPRDLRVQLGLPVTSPARTLLDLAGSLGPRALERAVDEAMVTRVVSAAQLRDIAARAIGRRGAGAPGRSRRSWRARAPLPAHAQQPRSASSPSCARRHSRLRRSTRAPAARKSTSCGASSVSRWRSTAGAFIARAARLSATGVRGRCSAPPVSASCAPPPRNYMTSRLRSWCASRRRWRAPAERSQRLYDVVARNRLGADRRRRP